MQKPKTHCRPVADPDIKLYITKNDLNHTKIKFHHINKPQTLVTKKKNLKTCGNSDLICSRSEKINPIKPIVHT